MKPHTLAREVLSLQDGAVYLALGIMRRLSGFDGDALSQLVSAPLHGSRDLAQNLAAFDRRKVRPSREGGDSRGYRMLDIGSVGIGQLTEQFVVVRIELVEPIAGFRLRLLAFDPVVMYCEAGLARNNTDPLYSSAFAMRPTGIRPQ